MARATYYRLLLDAIALFREGGWDVDGLPRVVDSGLGFNVRVAGRKRLRVLVSASGRYDAAVSLYGGKDLLKVMRPAPLGGKRTRVQPNHLVLLTAALLEEASV